MVGSTSSPTANKLDCYSCCISTPLSLTFSLSLFLSHSLTHSQPLFLSLAIYLNLSHFTFLSWSPFLCLSPSLPLSGSLSLSRQITSFSHSSLFLKPKILGSIPNFGPIKNVRPLELKSRPKNVKLPSSKFQSGSYPGLNCCSLAYILEEINVPMNGSQHLHQISPGTNLDARG